MRVTFAGLDRACRVSSFRVEKYRPNTLDELISHGDILTTSTLVMATALTSSIHHTPHTTSTTTTTSSPTPNQPHVRHLTPCHCRLIHPRSPTVQRFIDEGKLPHLLFYGMCPDNILERNIPAARQSTCFLLIQSSLSAASSRRRSARYRQDLDHQGLRNDDVRTPAPPPPPPPAVSVL